MKSVNNLLIVICILTTMQSTAQQSHSETEDTLGLKARVAQLEAEVRELKAAVKQIQPSTAIMKSDDQGASDKAELAVTPPTSVTTEERSTRDFLKSTTLNFAVDGYYGYNFNQPIGRVNLLRAYDVTSNSFSLNQANLIIEHAPDVSAGRRFGARLDLQYGQATETLQGSAANELRPQVYRPVFQAYGTYVAQLGSGLTVDFGKWSSALGIENNYSKDQINYSRSYFFNFLPFYHMGMRATYKFSDWFTATYALVNGVQQTEDFNGNKSQMLFLIFKPTKNLSWNINYDEGREQRDVVPVFNPGLPLPGLQPGLPFVPIVPTPNGRLHIMDSYVTWTATPKLTLALEGDYVINRVFSESLPTHVDGGAAYARYQLTSKTALAARTEYLSDRGGPFSGTTQALKETTLTHEYKFFDGFLMRTEWRRDFSNRPFFLSETPGARKKEQSTATVGLVWWFGQKQGAW